MNTGRTIFSQIMDFVPMHEFRKCVTRYHGNYNVKSFSCLDQFLCMAFAQLTYRESLRDIEACLRSMQSKLYHMGIRSKVSRNTLAYANEKRDWRIYADFAQILIHIARDLYINEDFGRMCMFLYLTCRICNGELGAISDNWIYEELEEAGFPEFGSFQEYQDWCFPPIPWRE